MDALNLMLRRQACRYPWENFLCCINFLCNFSIIPFLCWSVHCLGNNVCAHPKSFQVCRQPSVVRLVKIISTPMNDRWNKWIVLLVYTKSYIKCHAHTKKAKREHKRFIEIREIQEEESAWDTRERKKTRFFIQFPFSILDFL